jgi:hypothetical protein
MNSQLQELHQEIKLLKTLGTRQGFFQHYFEMLPRQRTQIECFNNVNDKHFELFGEYRYESYDSFRNQVAHYHKNKK